MHRRSLNPLARASQRLLAAALLSLLAFGCAQAPSVGGSAPIATAAPESAGMSSARLERITATFEQEVAAKRLPGAVAMVSRKGKLVYAKAFGVRDPKGSEPMQLDSVFRIYSMTKPFTAVAAMMLMEDGVLQLGDPVSRWLPAFKDVKVSTPQGDVAATRPMTVLDLLRHTAGLPYGELTVNTAVKDALTKAGLYKPNVIDFDTRDLSGAEQVDRLAKIPLLYQPGTTWEYSLATDVLGRVVEAASGQRLGVFLQRRLFGPLRMNDTAFSLLDTQRGRLAEPFEKDAITGAPIRLIDVSQPPANDSGGAGGVSTAGDYLRFVQMMLNGGTLDGVRVLSRSTVKLMASDHLGTRIPIAPTPGGGVLGASGYTFGLGLAVRPADGMALLPGSAGDYNWGGAFGTGFWVDPKEELTVVFMAQAPGPIRVHYRQLLKTLVLQAME